MSATINYACDGADCSGAVRDVEGSPPGWLCVMVSGVAAGDTTFQTRSLHLCPLCAVKLPAELRLHRPTATNPPKHDRVFPPP